MLEDSKIYFNMAGCKFLSRGLSPRYGIEWKLWELERAYLFQGKTLIATNNPKRKGCNDDKQAVGLVHSRGVTVVTLSETNIPDEED